MKQKSSRFAAKVFFKAMSEISDRFYNYLVPRKSIQGEYWQKNATQAVLQPRLFYSSLKGECPPVSSHRLRLN